MEEAFDPYRKWLGIPPEEQPPHHYRLLGIAVYEDDPDVISNAADRQMAHVRTFQGGKRAAQSQALLNELSSAKVCLLNQPTKRQYDARLRAMLTAAQPGATRTAMAGAERPYPTALPLGGGPDTIIGQGPAMIAQRDASTQAVALDDTAFADAAFVEEEPAQIPVTSLRGRPRRRSNSSSPLTWVIAGGAVAAVALVAVFMLSGDRPTTDPLDKTGATKTVKPEKAKPATSPRKESDEPKEASRNPVAGSPTREKTEIKPITNDRPRPKSDRPSLPAVSESENPAEKPDGLKNTENPPDTHPAANPKESAADPTLSPDGALPDSRPPVAKRPPLPSKESVDKAYRIARKELQQQLTEARRPEERHDLAQQIVEKAAEATDPAVQAALLTLARNLAVQMADYEQVGEVVDLLSNRFDVDAVELKRQSIEEIAGFVTMTLEDYQQLLIVLQRLSREAVALEKYDSALAVSRMAKTLSLKTRSAKAIKEFPTLEDINKDVDALAQDVAEYDREAKNFDRASKALARDPKDAAASLAVGRYWCLLKRDWAKGLPLLAAGNDPAWKDPAILDLANPKDFAALLAIGDGWVSLAKRKGGISKGALFERAKARYVQALFAAPSAQKSTIEAKIKEIDASLKPLLPPATSKEKQPDATKPGEKLPSEKRPDDVPGGLGEPPAILG